jgi:hypothetical protein
MAPNGGGEQQQQRNVLEIHFNPLLNAPAFGGTICIFRFPV